MTEPKRQPLVLVADDEEDWQKLIRESVEEMGARVLLAGNVQEACQKAAQHDPDSDDPLDLVILDMWMPLDAGPIPKTEEAQKEKEKKEKEGGLAFLRSYRLVRCPVIVFTRWPSFANCVKAVQQGAWAYVSKIETELEKMELKKEWGLPVLLDLCKKFLAKPPVAKSVARLQERPLGEPVPSEDWLERNYDWLRKECGGQWVALVRAVGVEETKHATLEREGVAVIRGASYEAVRELVVSDPVVLARAPEIVFVPEKD